MNAGSGGLGAVSVGISEYVVIAVIVVLIVGGWKLVKMLLLALKG